MKIWINNELVELGADVLSIEDLAGKLNIAQKGSALAVNDEIVTRGLWHGYMLSDGDRISVFRVIAGG
ncbi:sulfur carrier protein ThiS [Vibrio sp. SCSIO 43137]|uniref:sulfur carrier protein ThiS n=1 Tax=Vibrio sp. SCSIO 43137 TaxID=3021011 RepID=UPI0023073147|nr:sulfur carrier protein ThiS [Vibrio sp. SCSIO 43137]WCE32129.1 sulfur carrier protein ThiS [Vibrio sp. SCSIO 43137]